jgi:hypothetical protein
MKKLIGVIGVVAIAMTMFFSVNTTNALKGDFNLASFLEVNTANAECGSSTCTSYCYPGNQCFIRCNGYFLPCFGTQNTP